MKKILIVLSLLFVSFYAFSQVVRDSARVKMVNGDTIWSPYLINLKNYMTTGLGSGTVTSVAVTVPSGLSVTGSPITTSGTFAFSLADDLAAVEALASTGIVRRTASNTWSAGTTVAVTEGGNGLTTATLGDIRYGSGTNTIAALAGNITTTKKFLSQTGNGSISAVPSWETVTKTDVGLSAVENTALSTWAGSTNITTLGTIATGTWNATSIGISKGGTGQTAVGTANQLLGTNSAANATEWKSFATGTSGTDFNIAHTANTVTLNIPDAAAAARGLMSTGIQTVAGAKTWTGLATFSGASVHTGASGVAAVKSDGVIQKGVTAFTTGPQTLSGLHSEVNVTCSSASITINLPSPAAGNNGWTYTINKEDATAHYIVVVGTFNTGTNRVISGQGTSVVVQSNGTNWRVVN